VRREHGPHAKPEHRVLDVGGGASLPLQLAHRPARGRGLRLGIFRAPVRARTAHAMYLLGRVDEEKEEREGARGRGGQLGRERAHLLQQLVERRRVRIAVPARAAGAAK